MASAKQEDALPAVMTLKFDHEVLQTRVLEVRASFKEKYAENISSGVYDPRDLERFETNDKYASCFLVTVRSKGNVDKAVDGVDEVFRYRKEQGIWDWKDEDFPKEIWDKHSIFFHGTDRKGNPILQVRSKEMSAKTPEEIDMAKKFMAWNFEKHHREKAGVERVVTLFDMDGAGLGNVNIDMSKYLIHLFELFPSFGSE